MLDIILNQIRIMSYTYPNQLQLYEHKAYCLLDVRMEVDLDNAESLETAIDKIKNYYDEVKDNLQEQHPGVFVEVGYLFPLLQFRSLLVERLVDLEPSKKTKYALDLH